MTLGLIENALQTGVHPAIKVIPVFDSVDDDDAV